LRIGVGDFEGQHFGNAQSGSIGHYEAGPVADTGDVFEETLYFLLAENDRRANGARARNRAPASKGASRVTPYRNLAAETN
jgi:hypothetical protein